MVTVNDFESRYIAMQDYLMDTLGKMKAQDLNRASVIACFAHLNAAYHMHHQLLITVGA